MYKREKYSLTALSEEHLSLCNNLQNDEKTYQNLINIKFTNLKLDSEWVNNQKPEENLIGCYNNIPISRIRSTYLSPDRDIIELGLDIIPNERGKGHSKLFYKLLFSYFFSYKKIRMIYLRVLNTNTVASSAYEKIGFVKCGLYPKYIIREGKELDYLIYFKELDEKDIWSSNTSI